MELGGETMKKLDIAKAFKTRKTKYGGYATLITAVFLAIIFVINLIAVKLDLKVDLTKNKLYSISQPTYQVLDNLKQDIKIYGFFESGKEDPTIKSILDKYAARSKKVSIEYKDPVKYPAFAKQFSSAGEIDSGSVVVSCGTRFKLIQSADMVNYSYDYSGQPTADSLAVEEKVTSAIIYVTSDKTSVAYTLTGHGEASLSTEISDALNNQNYTIKSLNLLTKDANPESGSTIIINGPTKDLTTDEAAQLKDFLSKGGRAVFMMGLTQNDLPNFQSVLNSYGVGISRAVVVEGNSQMSTTNPMVLIPEMQSHDILNQLKSSNIPVLVPGSQVIDTLKVKKSSLKIEPLLVTSKTSWAKTNMQATTIEKETGDLQGPFNIAAAITDQTSNDESKNAKIVVFANSSFASSQYVNNGGNIDLMVSSLNWLQGNKETVTIKPKSLDDGVLNINAFQQLAYSGIVVIVIPLIIVVMGVRVWLRRRHQ
jgi:ABC-type uncharacterized transport system.